MTKYSSTIAPSATLIALIREGVTRFMTMKALFLREDTNMLRPHDRIALKLVTISARIEELQETNGKSGPMRIKRDLQQELNLCKALLPTDCDTPLNLGILDAIQRELNGDCFIDQAATDQLFMELVRVIEWFANY